MEGVLTRDGLELVCPCGPDQAGEGRLKSAQIVTVGRVIAKDPPPAGLSLPKAVRGHSGEPSAQRRPCEGL